MLCSCVMACRHQEYPTTKRPGNHERRRGWVVVGGRFTQAHLVSVLVAAPGPFGLALGTQPPSAIAAPLPPP